MAKIKSYSLNGFGLVLFFILWETASILVHNETLPTPIDVFQTIPDLFFTQNIQVHLFASFLRIVIGILVSGMIGFSLGVWMGKNQLVNKVVDPMVYLTYPIPKLALLPIFMLLFGLGEMSKFMLIFSIITPQMTLSVRDSVKSIPADYYEPYKLIHASSAQLFWLVTFPASLPSFLSTLRISLGIAISVLFFSENYGTEYGMGYFIMDMWSRMDYLNMYGSIFLLSTLGFILFVLIDGLNTRFLPWNDANK